MILLLAHPKRTFPLYGFEFLAFYNQKDMAPNWVPYLFVAEREGFALEFFKTFGLNLRLCFEKFFGHRSKTAHRAVFSLRSNPIVFLHHNKKPTLLGGFFVCGGERGIRTLGTVLAFTRFPIVRLRPAQPSLHLLDFYIITQKNKKSIPFSKFIFLF